MSFAQVSHRPRQVPLEQSLQILHAEYELARHRRSVRQFSSRPVPKEIIAELIQIAGTAPSGANLQPWHFVAIDDAELKQHIRLAAEREEKDFYERRAPQDWLQALQPLGTAWQKPFLDVAPWLIVVFRRRWQQLAHSRQKTYYSSESVGIAVGFLIAAIHRAGLVTLTHTPAPMNFLRELCGRPQNESPFVLMPVGYPVSDCMVPDISRKPLAEIVQWNA